MLDGYQSDSQKSVIFSKKQRQKFEILKVTKFVFDSAKKKIEEFEIFDENFQQTNL